MFGGFGHILCSGSKIIDVKDSHRNSTPVPRAAIRSQRLFRHSTLEPMLGVEDRMNPAGNAFAEE
jgi:hypothetical protein